MVTITALWLPILVSAVIVFIASSIIHMLLPYHRSNYKKLPGEEKIMESMRDQKVAPGEYALPCPADMKDMGSPEMVEKYEQGPVGFVAIIPSGPPAMGKSLIQWFVMSLVVGIFAAYLAGRTLGAGADYLAVFRIAGTAAFLGYSIGHMHDSIWKGQAWTNTCKFMFDGLVYALLTAGVFGWLWP